MNAILENPATPEFKANSKAALANQKIQSAMALQNKWRQNRSNATDAVPEFEALRDSARDIKNHVLGNLADYLEIYEKNVIASGGKVHWAETAEDARRIVLEICQSVDAKVVNKGKSMISEECGINDHLAAHGIKPVETDLGEYIIQLRGEMPSHIIAPAVHVTVPEVEEDFRAAHTHLPPDRKLDDTATLMAEARTVLREKYFEAEVGITGANFLIAETGQSV
ncbi:MAG: LUD domain-containing protein, partial [Pseudomonadota bacterium]